MKIEQRSLHKPWSTNRPHTLITGATGYLGSNLLRGLIHNNHKVTILKRSFSNTKRIDNFLEVINYFDLDKISIKNIFKQVKIDIILHCATNYGRKDIDPILLLDSNLILPLRLLELGKQNKVSCFINTDTILNKWTNYYSLSKNQFKEWLKMYSNDLICINMALEHFYGPSDNKTKFVSYIIDKFLNNEIKIDLTEGRQKRDFIYIDDVVEAFMKIIENLPGFTKGFYEYGVGSGNPIEIKKIVTLIKDLSGNISTELNFGALPYRENELMESKANTRALRDLGWKLRYPLKKGLLKTINGERRIGK